MSIPPLLSQWLVGPRPTSAELRFLLTGDGEFGEVEYSPEIVERTDLRNDYYNISAISVNNTNRIVCATQTVGKPFIVSDNRGRNWQVANPPVPAYSGFCERLHWIEDWQIFIGQSHINSSHSVVRGDNSGMNWTSELNDPAYMKRHSGFAFSPEISRAVVALDGNGPNFLLFDGGNWYPYSIPGPGCYSVFWSEETSTFIGFRPGSDIVKSSVDGATWVDIGFIPAECGNIAGAFAAYLIPMPTGERVLIFTTGGDAPAWFSDDNCATWSACSGMENTGSVTRYVAVDGEAVYVALNAELNTGLLSLDYGQSWERSDHLSGNASGIIALD